MKQYLTVKEVAESMGVYITVSGKINRTYFFEKCCYGSREDNHDI